MDANDEPVVFVQGDQDGTVSYNCAPGLGMSTVLELCGTGEMQPQADAVGIINDALTYTGEGHGWAASGTSDPLFDTAVQFTVDFLYPLLPCNQVTSISEITQLKTNVFPNPSSDYIQITSNNKINNIKLYNSIGKLLKNNSINKKEFSLSINNFSPGIYLIELIDENGNKNCKKILIN